MLLMTNSAEAEVDYSVWFHTLAPGGQKILSSNRCYSFKESVSHLKGLVFVLASRCLKVPESSCKNIVLLLDGSHTLPMIVKAFNDWLPWCEIIKLCACICFLAKITDTLLAGAYSWIISGSCILLRTFAIPLLTPVKREIAV